ncbi:MAG: hypothetical protein CMP10_18935 [Zetaproteobacteria bacterium]|nr:hypothetical protein [Pseudobdellovibrionaceae bacterium]
MTSCQKLELIHNQLVGSFDLGRKLFSPLKITSCNFFFFYLRSYLWSEKNAAILSVQFCFAYAKRNVGTICLFYFFLLKQFLPTNGLLFYGPVAKNYITFATGQLF